MDRVFLDANVLFSAAYRESSRLVLLWRVPEVELITSEYVRGEAARNLESDEQLQRLSDLLRSVKIFDEPISDVDIPVEVILPEKVLPILRAAIQSNATYLLTGDKTHFGQLYGTTVNGVLILSPAEFLATRQSDPLP